MKPLTILNVTAAGVICLGVFSAVATDQPLRQCIKFAPEFGTTDSMAHYAAIVHGGTGETLTGTMAYALVYIEYTDGGGGPMFDPNVKQLSLFPTKNGLYVVRILDLPPGLGLHGPF